MNFNNFTKDGKLSLLKRTVAVQFTYISQTISYHFAASSISRNVKQSDAYSPVIVLIYLLRFFKGPIKKKNDLLSLEV